MSAQEKRRAAARRWGMVRVPDAAFLRDLSGGARLRGRALVRRPVVVHRGDAIEAALFCVRIPVRLVAPAGPFVEMIAPVLPHPVAIALRPARVRLPARAPLGN